MLLFTVKYIIERIILRMLMRCRQMRSSGAPKGKFRSDEINVRETIRETKAPCIAQRTIETLEKNLERRVEGDVPSKICNKIFRD